ncbi:MAG: HDIG domain-containing protein [Candidatus Cloacimonetes bacterium]|nr:HDIG domain-containing protein [Candidatus Cloacimonadota bacterium]
MTRSKFFLILLTSLIISLIHFVVSPYRFVSYHYDLKLGEIAEKDIIAPFDFYVYKAPETLRAEQEAAAAKVQPIYKVSENLKFNAQKNLDFIIQHFTLSYNKDAVSIRNKLLQNGYDISIENVVFLQDNKRRQKVYNYLIEEFMRIFNIGIYPDNYRYQKIKIAKINKITEYELKRLYSLEEAKNKLISKLTSNKEINAIREMADIILIENIVIDDEMTNLEKQKARENVPLTIGKVQKNEKIVSKNQKITSIELLKLYSLIKAQKEQQAAKNNYELLLSSFGVFLLSMLIFILFYYVLSLFFQKEFSSYPRLIVISCSILVSVILTVFVNQILKIPSLIIPFSFSVLLVALIFNPHIGILFNFINLIFVSLFLNWSFINPAILSLATLGGIIALKKMKKQQEFYPLSLYLLLFFFIVITTVSIIRFEDISIYLWHLLWGIISCVTSVVGLILLTPFVERKLNMATKQILLELLDFDNPLLQKMSKITPGTYHHSLIVGNLAESAAEAVGANHLLARVGSYYHDIGKIETPQFFIENNPESSELHDKMLANESAILIKKHIADGVSLAKKYNLPKPVIEIIQQHHGTGQIRYFYNKALETNLNIDEEQFYYDGPKPRLKEAAIVMIADIVESTTKSLEEFSEETIKNVLDDTILKLINDGQLDETPITLKELETIKTFMLPIIMGVYRKRLEYPEK